MSMGLGPTKCRNGIGGALNWHSSITYHILFQPFGHDLKPFCIAQVEKQLPVAAHRFVETTSTYLVGGTAHVHSHMGQSFCGLIRVCLNLWTSESLAGYIYGIYNVYSYIYIYMCIYIYICMYTYMYTSIYIYIHMYVYIIYIYMYYINELQLQISVCPTAHFNSWPIPILV